MDDRKRQGIVRGVIGGGFVLLFILLLSGSDRMAAQWYRYRLAAGTTPEDKTAAARNLVAMVRAERCELTEDLVNYYLKKLHSDGAVEPRPPLIGEGLAGLKELGKPVIGYLQYSFSTPGNLHRLFDAQAVLEIEPETAGPMYLSVAQDPSQAPELRICAAFQVGRLKYAPAADALRALTADPQWGIRSACAGALASMGQLELRAWNTAQLDDPLHAIRLGAAMYMTSHGWREGVPTLIALVQDAPPAIRPVALAAMREVADVSIIQFPADPNAPAWTAAAGLLRTWWDQNAAKLKLRNENN
ncbi:MAG: hypothetical protein HZA54_02790 [Planctomycetes bacterium]|nr:hypothetical protein [Planctomycetota bacterium]